MRAGPGRALMDAVLRGARRTATRRLWLVTTNDNIRAIRFHQRWGMDLAAFVRHGVAASRKVKPSIPMVGDEGIPVRHELEFELCLE
ncbi:MAG TPA: GNAT family N-acetyltransferase [Acidimicrobiales bacterium]|nr:GNAT family N-acetyltransferase [Acidimicrobiales bacterium]